MAYTRLSDVVVPEVMVQQVVAETSLRNNLINSGAMVGRPELAATLNGPGGTVTVPLYKSIVAGAAEANLGNDDPTVSSTPTNISSHELYAKRIDKNVSFGFMDFASALAKADPAAAVAGQLGSYWVEQIERSAFAALKGVLANSDMAAFNIDVTAATDKKLSPNNLIAAESAFGELVGGEAVLVVHSKKLAELRTLGLIDFVSLKEQTLAVPTFLGYRVVVSDKAPTDGTEYTSYLLRTGALNLVVGTPENGIELLRKPEIGNGQGGEILFSRARYAVAVNGASYIGSGLNPNNAALATAANWDVPGDAKVVGAIALTTL